MMNGMLDKSDDKSETPRQSQSERRLETLQALSARTAGVTTADDACRFAAEVLAENAADLPFALLYLAAPDGRSAQLAGAAGVLPEQPWSPETLSLEQDEIWPVAAAAASEGVLIDDLERRFGSLGVRDGAPAPRAALVLPVALPGAARPAAVLVAGLNPRLALDRLYRGFLQLAAAHLATVLAGVRALGEARIQAEALAQSAARAAEMERAVRFSEMLVGIIGHDLRNPLSAITTAANLLEVRADSEKIAKPVSRIVVSADRMERMISQLLDFTRIRIGRGILLDRTTVDLAEVARATVEEIGPVQKCQILIESSGDVTGLWDRDRLFQLLSNLTANACQHGAKGSPVVIRLDGSDADTVHLEVQNSGAVPPELLPVLFEPLRRIGDRLEKREGSSGLGFGLFITQQIVLAHGGSVRAESSEEHGTRILVELPRRLAPEADGLFRAVPASTRGEA